MWAFVKKNKLKNKSLKFNNLGMSEDQQSAIYIHEDDVDDLDEKTVNLYHELLLTLKTRETTEEFMEIISEVLFQVPELCSIRNIAIIINDARGRHPNIRNVAGRTMLQHEIKRLRANTIKKSDADKIFMIIHTYYLTFLLREYNNWLGSLKN
jgi:hypothetical protein